MPFLAVVLALSLPAVTPLAPRSGACPDIDPHFVRFVPGPRGSGPLWAVQVAPTPSQAPLDPHFLDFGPAHKASAPAPEVATPCPRLLHVLR